jgi:hypothetical protein
VTPRTPKLEKIGKAELVDRMAQRANMSKKNADDVFSAALEEKHSIDTGPDDPDGDETYLKHFSLPLRHFRYAPLAPFS